MTDAIKPTIDDFVTKCKTCKGKREIFLQEVGMYVGCPECHHEGVIIEDSLLENVSASIKEVYDRKNGDIDLEDIDDRLDISRHVVTELQIFLQTEQLMNGLGDLEEMVVGVKTNLENALEDDDDPEGED